MLFPRDHTKKKIDVPLINPNEEETLPHIKKFERETEKPTGAQAALEQSKNIFGPFRKTPRFEKTSFVKSQEKSFLQVGKVNSDKD
ncbi:hypothetical protein [Agaribacterium sp. ZY112]|uniref:hypothetical protein n=1 Tax=Agaribacterium sp. ZY112 TaxID=3233574 RepID=UPI003524E956